MLTQSLAKERIDKIMLVGRLNGKPASQQIKELLAEGYDNETTKQYVEESAFYAGVLFMDWDPDAATDFNCAGRGDDDDA